MTEVSDALNRLYKETGEFIILGITGRTGSGCSTAARILSSEKPQVPEKSKIYSSSNDERKYRIVQSFIQENWRPFVSIQVRTIITAIILELNFSEFLDFIGNVLNIEVGRLEKDLEGFKEFFEEAHQKIVEYKSIPDKERQDIEKKKDKAWDIYFDYLPEFCEKIKKVFQENISADACTLIYQKAGDNIRASGSAHIGEFDADKIFTMPKKINKLIKVIRAKKKEKAFIVIDAIRSPFEATGHLEK
jgi:hypothetical protein